MLSLLTTRVVEVVCLRLLHTLMVTSQLNSTSATSSTCGWSDHTLFCHSSCVGLYQLKTISGGLLCKVGFWCHMSKLVY